MSQCCFLLVQTLHGRQDERVLHELKEWHNNFISVQEYMDELALVKGKARNLKEDVSGRIQFSDSDIKNI